MKIDAKMVQQAIETLHPNNELFEIRILGKANGFDVTYSGYFRDSKTAVEQLQKLNLTECNVFHTLNQLDSDFYYKEQRDKLKKTKEAIKDENIVKRNFLLVDLDPVRLTKISSNEEEKKKAKQKAKEVIEYTQKQGLYAPLVADSGNGYHLLYRVDIEREQDEIIKRVLKHLCKKFSDDFVKVDVSVTNLARICKLYGTTAQKGANVPERPHRLSQILQVPKNYNQQANTIEQLELIADAKETAPTVKQNSYNNSTSYKTNYNTNYSSCYNKIDLQEFIQKHNIPIKETKQLDKGTGYILEQCIFDPSHKGKDAMFISFPNGDIGYQCFHDHCNDKKFSDVVKIFEPDAYTHKEAHREPQTHYSDYNTTNYTPTATTQHRGADSVTEATEQPTQDTRVSDYMQNGYKEDLERFKRSITGLSTGFEKLDYHLGGCINVGLYVLGAISSLGKTTLVHQIADNIANQKRDVLYFSLEMSRLELVTKSVAREQAKALLNEGKSCLEQEGKASIEIRKGYGNEHTTEATARYMMHKAKYMHIYEADINTCTADAIISNITSFIERNPDAKPVIFVDYLQIIQQEPTAKVVDTKTHLDRTIVKFKQLSRDINAPIFLISSINRANYLSLIDFESFKETGAIEYTADVVLGLQLQVMKHDVFNSSTKLNHKRELVRVAKKETQRKVELVCLKNRYANSSFTSYFEYYSKYDLFEEKEEASEVLLFAEAFDDLQAEYEDLEAQGYTYLKMKANGHYNE